MAYFIIRNKFFMDPCLSHKSEPVEFEKKYKNILYQLPGMVDKIILWDAEIFVILLIIKK